jgi:hypothetical protein
MALPKGITVRMIKSPNHGGHDPLCPGCVAADGLCDSNCAACQCDLIAKVRDDMLAKCIAAINAIEPYHMQAQLYRREEIDAALRALEEKP